MLLEQILAVFNKFLAREVEQWMTRARVERGEVVGNLNRFREGLKRELRQEESS